MRSLIASLLRNNRGSSAVEFAIVLPLLLVLLLGMIDIGRYMWTINQIQKAAQMGVRYAVVSDPVAEVINTDFVNYGIPGGDPVPTTTFGSATCTDSGDCDVTGDATETGRNATAFNYIVSWMQNFDRGIQPGNVTVAYQNVGLGYSGDPNGPNVAALTTVQVSGLTFQPLMLFGGSIDLPVIKASLTLEDGECSTTGDCGSSN